ncbi:type II secretion system protein [Pseudoduganella chitinolytica]|uniref:Type II secretion system protein n=1 Tax=Pseudoduganella chitinolytica TaxID=34070 RepID=A0ABY8BFT8_9BURK|nr:type II secretion system protein [Pseudoduganella chitinolytica]WEF34787.1 type II secretion system protein [Pseudoduganella chitinolytica]
MAPTQRQRGASLFEFAVCTAVFAILAGLLLERILRYRAEAEREGVVHQVENMRSALLSRVLAAEVAGNKDELHALVGSNPVALLRHAPIGYAGEIDNVDTAELTPGSWYFDRKQQKLVYVFTRNKRFRTGTVERWGFKVEFIRLPTNNAKPPGTQPNSAGVVLNQVDG